MGDIPHHFFPPISHRFPTNQGRTILCTVFPPDPSSIALILPDLNSRSMAARSVTLFSLAILASALFGKYSWRIIPSRSVAGDAAFEIEPINQLQEYEIGVALLL